MVRVKPYLKTSPSQITTFDLCPRRWHFGSVQFLPQTQSKEAAEGEVLHRQEENYQNHGTMPAHPSVVKSLAWLPPPKDENVGVELKTTNPPLYVAGLLINGRVDLLDARDPLFPVVIDHKSKGSLKSLMSKAKLAEDTQLNLYAKWAFLAVPEAQAVSVAHNYLVRDADKADAKLVQTAPLSREHVDGVVDRLIPSIEKMKVASTAERAEDLAPNPEACWAFGKRCDFYDRCYPTATARFQAAFGETTATTPPTPSTTTGTDMSLLEKLKSQQGAASIPSPLDVARDAEVARLATAIETATPPPVSGTPTAGYELYIDCTPFKGADGPTVRLEEEIYRRVDEIVKSHGAKSLYEKPLDYGKGKDMLTESFRTSPPNGIILATTGGLSTAVIEALAAGPLAKRVVRGAA